MRRAHQKAVLLQTIRVHLMTTARGVSKEALEYPNVTQTVHGEQIFVLWG